VAGEEKRRLHAAGLALQRVDKRRRVLRVKPRLASVTAAAVATVTAVVSGQSQSNRCMARAAG
jgi:hypothetical protein